MRIRPTEAAPLPSPASTQASAPRPPASSSAGGGSSFARLMGGLGRELDRGEAVVRASLRGSGSSDPAALLALQAGIYRYVEAVDLAAKLVDRAASAVKTTLQSQ